MVPISAFVVPACSPGAAEPEQLSQTPLQPKEQLSWQWPEHCFLKAATSTALVFLLAWLALQVLEANAAAPTAEKLSDAELVISMSRLAELRAGVDAEVAALLASTEAETQAQEIRAERLKALCWDSMQVGEAGTGAGWLGV